MDAALQSMLSSQSGGGGGERLMGLMPDIGSTSLEAVFPLGPLSLDEFLKKLLPMLQQALVFNFPGGFVFRTFFQQILDILKQSVDMTAYGVTVGEVGQPNATPGAGKGGGGVEIG